MFTPRLFCILSASIFLLLSVSLSLEARLERGQAHIWDMQEIHLRSAQTYENPYMDVVVWIDLEGPDFAKRVYGFWDGDRDFRVRFVATAPGQWKWKSGSNQVDAGLNGGRGSLEAIAWPEAAIEENPNRRGFIRATPNGRALEYADGTPFFLQGDTWLAASTWRLPYKGTRAAPDYVPGPGISFEEAVAFRKRLGFNSVSFIAAFPNWAADHRGATYANEDGIFLRNAWEKFGHWAPDATITTDDGATTTAKDMHDEDGNRPFEVFADREGLADFDRIVPAYFQNLDRKMRHLADEGFVPFIETVRRDNTPSWKAYFDFDESYARFVQYIISRYGAYNQIFSGIHLDWIPEDYSLTADEFNQALTHHYHTYGPMPFGQPYTVLIDSSTYQQFGHGEDAPWLDMHTVGNKPRNHAIYASIEEIFHLEPPFPAANLEPYYTGWNHEINRPGGETPAANSPRDNYFSRAQMYGSVLSGGLAGHVHGTAAYDITTTGEPAGWRPYIWEALKYESGAQMRHLTAFMLSEGRRYQDLLLASTDLHPRSAPDSIDDGLDGWSFMMRTAEADLAFLYFEHEAIAPRLSGLQANAAYQWNWYNPETGEWEGPMELTTDAEGSLQAPTIPDAEDRIMTDWAAKLKRLAQPS